MWLILVYVDSTKLFHRCFVSFIQAVWLEQEQNMKKELAHMKDRVVVLQTQNTTLHEELEKVHFHFIS